MGQIIRMFHASHPRVDPAKFIIRGLQLELTETLRQSAVEKASRLFRHRERIDRVQLDLGIARNRGPAERFQASGRLELEGPDLVASVHSENAYKSIDLLVATFDAMLLRRHQQREKSVATDRPDTPTG